jgi:hypothetical protein
VTQKYLGVSTTDPAQSSLSSSNPSSVSDPLKKMDSQIFGLKIVNSVSNRFPVRIFFEEHFEEHQPHSSVVAATN